MPPPGDIRVVRLATTPVKGLRLLERDRIELDADGARGDRRFYLIDERDRMVNSKQIGQLQAVVPEYDHPSRSLTLHLPDGTVVTGSVELGNPIQTRFYSRPARGRLVAGPWAEALSACVGTPLRLVETTSARAGVDRGRAGGVSLISRASLEHLAALAAEPQVDPRRFRMLVEVEGTPAYEEDGWVGDSVRIGAALVRMRGHVGRCLITSRDPESGEVDLPTLDLLSSYRSAAPTTEPLAFGIYGEVIEPGPVRLGDRVMPV